MGVKAKALRFLDYFDVQYEYLANNSKLDFNTAKYNLKQAPIQIATAVCSGWSNAPVVQKCNQPIEHATLIYNTEDLYFDFDSYAPYRKKLAGDYLIPYAMKGLVTPKFNIKKNYMSKLLRKKNTKEVFLVLNNRRYWVKDLENFDDLVKSGPVTISWEQVEEVPIFTQPYGGEIIGKANLADALSVLFGRIN
jgi:hypothetical protein